MSVEERESSYAAGKLFHTQLQSTHGCAWLHQVCEVSEEPRGSEASGDTMLA